MKRFFKRLWDGFIHFAWGSLLAALLLIVAGGLYLLFPAEAVEWVGRVVGGLLLLVFLFALVRLFARRTRGVPFFLWLVADVLALLAGGLMLFAPAATLEYLTLAIGLGAIMLGSIRLAFAAESKRYHLFGWWALVLLAGGAVAGGLWLLRFPFLGADGGLLLEENARLMGGLMVLCGILEFFAVFFRIFLNRQIKKEMAATTVIIDAAGVRAQAEAARAAEAPTGGEEEGTPARTPRKRAPRAKKAVSATHAPAETAEQGVMPAPAAMAETAVAASVTPVETALPVSPAPAAVAPGVCAITDQAATAPTAGEVAPGVVADAPAEK